MGNITNTKNTINITYKHDFPLKVYEVPFSQYSQFPANIDKKKQVSPAQQKNIIIGGEANGDGFYELIVDNNTNSINYKSFANDYNKKFANLKHIGLDDARQTHSYLVQNHKYLVVFEMGRKYNVYDIENDQWMLRQYEKLLRHHISWGSQSALINDEMIIISSKTKLYFHFIGNNHIRDPIFAHEYTLKTKGVSFHRHGMCITNFIQQKSQQDELYHTYMLKIILFGGDENKDFLSSFLYLDVLLSYISNDAKYQLVSLSIDENLIDKNKIKLVNMNTKTIPNSYEAFGFECVFNSKNEPIVIVIGSCGSGSKDICLFNCITHELTLKKRV